MSQKVKQQLSALVDNDKVSGDVIDKIKQDKALSDTFGRYNLIGDVMRNDVPEQIHLDIADSIADAIEKEPVVLAPNREFSAAVSEKQEAQEETKERSNNVVSLFKPLMQYGLAASFAAALVVGFQTEQTDTLVPQSQLTPVPIAGQLDPVSIEQSTPVMNRQSIQEQQRRVNSYILDHEQQLKNRQFASFDTTDAEPVEESNSTDIEE
ncbi:hypothetical protein HR060_06050 [Catenovulum sp. SM1970]|uniref:sigma-E factor negative regulatory protein n=1 Tax=Marinifaba aquimaris TaxID=2741323 RepID=UPI0015747A71|nr:RseA family anti-sigma factor [Marinifaba aquimaris]NTS76427.1 hypothetical protein [Marinifaba aquimaris]